MSQRFFWINPRDVGKASARFCPKQVRCIYNPQRCLTRRIDRFLLRPFELEPQVIAKLRIKLLQIGRHGNVNCRHPPDPYMLRDRRSQNNENGERNHAEDLGLGTYLLVAENGRGAWPKPRKYGLPSLHLIERLAPRTP